jgi:hypothetical protein
MVDVNSQCTYETMINSLIIREMEVKCIMMLQYPLTGLAKMKKTDDTRWGEDACNRDSYTLLVQVW